MKYSKINNFDLIRLFAALQVVIGHSVHHLDVKFIPYDYFLRFFPGVPIFFLVSGYLISSAYQRSPTLRHYAFNRFVRIFPALWVCLLFTVIMVIFVVKADFSLIELTQWIFAQATIGQFYNPDFLRSFGVGVINGSLWTIPVEIQFYLMTPILYFFIQKFSSKKSGYALIFLFLFFLIINQVYGRFVHDNDEISILGKLFGVTFIPYFCYFLLGCILQKYRDYIIQLLSGKLIIIIFSYMVLAVICDNLGLITYGSFITPLLLIPLAMLVICVAYTKKDFSFMTLKGNDISYGVYIYHMLWVNLFIYIGFENYIGLWAVILFTVLSGFVSWRIIERPVLSFKR
ncbi:TPA: acyltransferase family protein [Vibrio alginolyticus]